MALAEVVKVDFSFKKLEGREETTIDKQWYEEFAGRLLYPHSKDVWVEDIPIPAPSSSTSIVKVYDMHNLTRDITVNYNRSWLLCDTENDLGTRVKGLIPPRFDQTYTARIFENNGDEIPTAHPSNWVFDYENGVLFFENNPVNYGIQLPIKIKTYQYRGKTLKDILDSGIGGGDNTKVITTAVAGESIQAYQLVYFKGDGKVYIADKDNQEILESVLGVAISDVSQDNNVDVILNGNVTNSNWALQQGQSYFLNGSGNITITPVTTGILIKVGTAKDNNTLIFEPKQAIKR